MPVRGCKLSARWQGFLRAYDDKSAPPPPYFRIAAGHLPWFPQMPVGYSGILRSVLSVTELQAAPPLVLDQVHVTPRQADTEQLCPQVSVQQLSADGAALDRVFPCAPT